MKNKSILILTSAVLLLILPQISAFAGLYKAEHLASYNTKPIFKLPFFDKKEPSQFQMECGSNQECQSYFSEMTEKVNWSLKHINEIAKILSQKGEQPLFVTTRVFVDSRGRMKDAVIAKPSGNPSLDEATLRGIKLAFPMRPPQGKAKEVLDERGAEISIEFRFAPHQEHPPDTKPESLDLQFVFGKDKKQYTNHAIVCGADDVCSGYFQRVHDVLKKKLLLPDSALNKARETYLDFSVLLDGRGKVTVARVDRSSGDEDLDLMIKSSLEMAEAVGTPI